MRNYYSFSLASIIAVALAAPAFAQEQPPVDKVAEREGVISYTPADFAAARPNTALDMINRLPGFAFNGGEQVRGFAGAAGNVLIDGQRPTIKTDSLGDTLGRITIGAGSVITRSAPAGKLSVSRARQATVEGWQRPRRKGEE